MDKFCCGNHACGSYRHIVAECPDSWENMMKRKASKGNMKSVDQSNKEKIMGEIELRGDAQSDQVVCVMDQLQLM